MTDYCQNCAHCTNTLFSKDCYNCEDCFGCVGLRRKKYYIFNKPYSKEDYEKYVSALDLSQQDLRQIIFDKRLAVEGEAAQLGIHQVQTEDCIGDNLSQCKGCYQCYLSLIHI